jgi:thiol-disulfide isomerase/thioredoxin
MKNKTILIIVLLVAVIAGSTVLYNTLKGIIPAPGAGQQAALTTVPMAAVSSSSTQNFEIATPPVQAFSEKPSSVEQPASVEQPSPIEQSALATESASEATPASNSTQINSGASPDASSNANSEPSSDAKSEPSAKANSEPSAKTNSSKSSETVSEPETQPNEGRTKAPDFTVYDLEGNTVKLSDMLGKPVVINFWASWCPPCKSEMPDFNKVYTELGDDVHFMMIDAVDGMRETQEKGTAYVEEQGFSFPVYFDISQNAIVLYRIRAFPTTIFIDAEGYLVTGAEGAITEELLRLGIDMSTI